MKSLKQLAIVNSRKQTATLWAFQTPSDDKLSASSKEFKKSVLLSSTKPPEKQLKIFVFEEALANAFGVCFQCGAACLVFCKGFIGTNCKIRVSCARNNSHQFSWSTGPLHNHMPILHLLLSSSILCGGLQPSKVFRLFESLNVPCINQREFCNLQNAYVIPAVFNMWKQNQEEVLKDSFIHSFIHNLFGKAG